MAISTVPGKDGSIFIPAVAGAVQTIGGTWTVTRTALGNYNLVRTAGAAAARVILNLGAIDYTRQGTPNTPQNPGNPGFNYPMPASLGGNGQVSAGSVALVNSAPAQPTGGSRFNYRSPKITSVDVVFSIATLALNTAHSLAFEEAFYATGSAVTVVEKQAAVNLGLVTTTNLAVVNANIITPYVLGAVQPDVADFAELLVDDTGGGTSVYTLYGFNVYFDYIT
jgi:hypothetical protein